MYLTKGRVQLICKKNKFLNYTMTKRFKNFKTSNKQISYTDIIVIIITIIILTYISLT